jgi:mono/diheme cytochrome c family protein
MKKLSITLMILLVVSCGKKKEQDFYAVQDNELKKSYARGEVLYSDFCISCHMANGEGVPKAFPPLAKSDYLKDKQTESIKGIKNGMSGEIVVNGVSYNGVMAGMGLSDQEVADVMNYINNAWGNDYGEFYTAQKVTKITP